MNYRTAIQIQIKALQELYDNANHLRDVASENEKAAWNNMRRLLPQVWGPLQEVDNALSQGSASYEVKGDYSIKIDPSSI